MSAVAPDITGDHLDDGASTGPTRRRRWLLFGSLRATFCLTVLAIVALIALLADVISPTDPIEQTTNLLKGPSGDHWLGTDDLGRDVLSRMIHGTRVSLLASMLAVGVALLVGLPLGLLSGYLGGVVDAVLMRIVDTLLSFPAIILAIGITAALGPSLTNSMISVGFVFAPSIARLIRAQVLSVKEELFVEVTRSFGTSTWRVVWRHIVPNAIQPVLVQSSILLGLALLAEASLSFLGLGVQPPDASWGSMLARSYSFISRSEYQIFIPGLAIAVTIYVFNTLGDVVQDALDPRRRRSD